MTKVCATKTVFYHSKFEQLEFFLGLLKLRCKPLPSPLKPLDPPLVKMVAGSTAQGVGQCQDEGSFVEPEAVV